MSEKKKITKVKKQNISNQDNQDDSIEKKYIKKTQIEHILDRPDMYIGSTALETSDMFVYDSELDKIVERNITFSPALYKIYDEAIDNASDRLQQDKTCNTLWVNIDQNENIISVKNNGLGIEIVEHKDHNMYLPTLLFSELLSGENFDDTKDRISSGKNGIGIKANNIYSKKFTVETIDKKRKLKFVQVFENNMSIKNEPEITKYTGDSYTQVTFQPDLERFGLKKITNDLKDLFFKRALDIAGVHNKKVTIFINDIQFNFKNFGEYAKKYVLENNEQYDETYDEKDSEISSIFSESLIYEEVDKNWQIAIAYVPLCGFKQVSFVNGICTYRGGSHVKHITDIIVEEIRNEVCKKAKIKTTNSSTTETKKVAKSTKNTTKTSDIIKPQSIKNNIFVFINSTIVKPVFDGQSKEELKMPIENKCKISNLTLKKLFNTGLITQLIDGIENKYETQISKTVKKESKLHDIIKLEDASKAGTKDSYKCSLILTEGDSAKALALQGLTVVGKEYYGVFPLKGKLLNVRNETPDKIFKNQEIMNIMRILALVPGKTYKDIRSLRYGKIIIMTDQDVDGFHIKGLLLNFIHYLWPSLIMHNDFIQYIKTPIVKATKGKNTKEFYNLTDFELWKENNNGWTIKYYKGLGTSNKTEAIEYFKNLDELLISYKISEKDNELNDEQIDKFIEKDIIEGKILKKPSNKINWEEECKIKQKFKLHTTECISLSFHKNRADERKIWLNNTENTVLNDGSKSVTIPDFINKELILFSKEDNIRNIPNIIDGLKPSQRKVLYAAFKKNLNSKKKEIKVEQFGGYVSENTAYHHGEASLHTTIINMAQDYTGSNNINYLVPSGQFGDRQENGKNHASPRYIYTYLTEITRLLFRKEDDEILDYVEDDCQIVEPFYYVPILPTILINGTIGIGTGWSTNIPMFNPEDICEIIISKINDEEPDYENLKPWYFNFKGTILRSVNNKENYICYGSYMMENNENVLVKEVPIGKAFVEYKSYLTSLVEHKKIISYTSDLTKSYPKYNINIDSSILYDDANKKLYDYLNLVSTISTTNMHLNNKNGDIKKYSIQDIVDEFYEERLNFYTIRKDFLKGKLEHELDILKYTMKFIQDFIDDKIKIAKTKKDKIISQLEKLKYPKLVKKYKSNIDNQINNEDNNDQEPSYNYLLDLGIMKLSQEELNKLQEKIDNKEEELAILLATSEKEQWLSEIDEFRKEYIKWRDSKIEIINEHDSLIPDNTVKGKKATRKIKK